MAPAPQSPVLTDPARHRPPLGDLRVLANGRSAALIGPDAAVGWWCAPEFDGMRPRATCAVPPSPVTDVRGRPGLLAEEVDPRVDEDGGNVPLVWSHAEAARAMYVLDAATLRARFGLPLYGHGDR